MHVWTSFRALTERTPPGSCDLLWRAAAAAAVVGMARA
jgi:hypothetical protein